MPITSLPMNGSMHPLPAHTLMIRFTRCDTPGVLRAKVGCLAGLVRQAAQGIVYTGAGISVAAGIDDYATPQMGVVSNASVTLEDKPQLKGGTVDKCLRARPTLTHHVLTGERSR